MASSPEGFNRQVQLLINSGTMSDKGWPVDKIIHETQHYLKIWKKLQTNIQYTLSPISYIELKKSVKGNRKDVLAAAKEGDVNNFTVIQTHPDHHAIIDEQGEVLGYRYRIKSDFLKTLAESTSNLPSSKMKAGVRGKYPTRHYTVWRDYSMIPRESSEYIKDLPESKEWCEQNSNLFKYLSEGLRMISPRTYARYGGTKSYLQSRMKLKPLCRIWFGAAINQ